MTKKDYILLARTLEKALAECKTSEQRAIIEKYINILSKDLQAQNVRFDSDKFIKAIITK